MKRAFTIVELLLVIGIIGVLTAIVTTAAAGAMKNSRARRATAMCHLVQAGLDTYHAQYGKWPGTLPNVGENAVDDDPQRSLLSGTQVQQWILELVQKSKDGTPVMDVSGLFVSDKQGESGQKCYGRNFMEAIRGSKQHRQRMSIAKMYFGYQDTNTGYFRRFKITYSHATDSVSVSTQ